MFCKTICELPLRQERFMEAKAAYETLANPASRADYDSGRTSSGAAAGARQSAAPKTDSYGLDDFFRCVNLLHRAD